MLMTSVCKIIFISLDKIKFNSLIGAVYEILGFSNHI